MAEESTGFSDFIKGQMQRHGWNGAEFARAAGVAPSVVSRWLRGHSRPDPANVKLVADRLGFDPDYLFALAGYRRAKPEDESPEAAAICTKARQINWTQDRFLTVDTILELYRNHPSELPGYLSDADRGGRNDLRSAQI